MTADQFDWDPDSLSDEDKRLIDAYQKVGTPLDMLAYTSDFDALIRSAGFEVDDDKRAYAFRRLLNLRKRGRLPRLTRDAVIN